MASCSDTNIDPCKAKAVDFWETFCILHYISIPSSRYFKHTIWHLKKKSRKQPSEMKFSQQWKKKNDETNTLCDIASLKNG